MDDLIKEYREALKDIRRQKALVKEKIVFQKKLLERDPDNKEIKKEIKRLKKERKIFTGTESDLVFTIQWMKSGHMPGIRRGIERRASYQNEKPIDPLTMQRYFRSSEAEFPWDKSPKECVITRTEKEIIEEAVNKLSQKEMEVYLLAKGKSFSQYKIADMMNISRSSVKVMIRRADQKIARIMNERKMVV